MSHREPRHRLTPALIEQFAPALEALIALADAPATPVADMDDDLVVELLAHMAKPMALDGDTQAAMSLLNPHDGLPDQSPGDANLREADDGSENYCGNCRFFNQPPLLGEQGTCVVVQGAIDANDVCTFYSQRAEPISGVILPPADVVPARGVIDLLMPPPIEEVPEVTPDIEPVTEPLATDDDTDLGDETVPHPIRLDKAEFGAGPDGVIITVEPLDAERLAIALPGGVPAEMLHLTMLWLGHKGDPHLDREAIVSALLEVTGTNVPLEGKIAGLGTFGESEDDLLIALVDVPGLFDLRADLIDALEGRGVHVPEDRGWTPHITLARDPIPGDTEVVGLPLTFNDMTLRWGLRVIDVAFVEAPDEAEQEDSTNMAWIVVANNPDCMDESGGEMPHAVWNWETEERDGCFATLEEAAMRAEALNEAIEDAEGIEDEIEDAEEMPMFVVAPDNPECVESSGGELPNAVVNALTGEVEGGCHATVEEAQAVADDMNGGEPRMFEVVENSPECMDATDGEMSHAVVDIEMDEVVGCWATVEEAQVAADELNDGGEIVVDEEVDMPDMPDAEVAPEGEAIPIVAAATETEGPLPDLTAARAALNVGRAEVQVHVVPVMEDGVADRIADALVNSVVDRLAARLGVSDALTAAADGDSVTPIVIEGPAELADDVQVIEAPADGIEKEGIEVPVGETGELAAEDDDTTEFVDQTTEFGAIAAHDTPTIDEPWDAAAIEVNVVSPNDPDYFDRVYAWRDDEADLDVKAAYRFIHHEVDADGNPGAANVVAAITGIAVLNGARGGTTIPGDDRQGVYDHLAAHLADAEMDAPELLSDEDASLVASQVEAGTVVDLTDPDSVLAALAAATEVEVEGSEVEAADGDAEEFPVEVEFEADVQDDESTDLADIDTDLLVAEIARRWAETEADKIVAAVPAEAEAADEDTDESVTADAAEIVEEEPVEAAAHDEDDDMGGEAEAFVHPEGGKGPFHWEGVLIVEGLPSGDGRMIASEALTHRELPIPLMLQTVNAMGHDGAVIAGSIHEIDRAPTNTEGVFDIIGRGYFDSGDNGQEAQRLISEGTMRGVSADIDSVVVEFRSPEGDAVDFEDVIFGEAEAIEVLIEGRIMGATITPFPAFQEAHIAVIDSADVQESTALVAAGVMGDVWTVSRPLVSGEFTTYSEGHGAGSDPQALVASAAAATLVEVPCAPPVGWFGLQDMEEPHPVRVDADGRIFGLVAQWGSCHIGFSKRCVTVPKGGAPFASFRTGHVLTEEGTLVATGPVYIDAVHPDLRKKASDAQAFYAHTGCAVADVALYENEWGIVASGSLRSDVTPEMARALRGSDISPDWRKINGKLTVVGLLAVNVSGFIVEGLVASGGEAIEVHEPMGVFDTVSGEAESVVGLGMVKHNTGPSATEVEALRAEVAELRAAMRPFRAERTLAKLGELRLIGGTEVLAAAEEPSTEIEDEIDTVPEGEPEAEFAEGDEVTVDVEESAEAAIEEHDCECGDTGECACAV